MRTKLILVLFTALVASTSGAQQLSGADCLAAGNSPLREPQWWPAACGHLIPAEARVAVKGSKTIGDAAFHVDLRATPDSFQTFALPDANAATVIAATASQPFYGLEHDNATGVLYAVDATALQLGTLNKATGAFTSLVTISGLAVGQSITGLAFQSWATGPVYLSTADGTTSNL